MLKGQNPQVLRQSAAALLLIAAYIEAGEKKELDIDHDLKIALSPIIFDQLALKIPDFQQVREIAELGFFGDAALAIILSAMNSPDGRLEVSLDDLESITGLPISSSLRLLKELSARQAIRLEQPAHKKFSVQFVAHSECHSLVGRIVTDS